MFFIAGSNLRPIKPHSTFKWEDHSHLLIVVDPWPTPYTVEKRGVGAIFNTADFELGDYPDGVVPLLALPKPVKIDFKGIEPPVNEGFGNPKHALGTAKIPLHLFPPIAIAQGALGIWEGLNKYGRNNFRGSPVYATVYIAAAKRHLDAYLEGENQATDSQVHHIGHVLACAAILLDAGMVGTLVDDRNFNGQNYGKAIEELTPLVRMIEEKYKDKKPRHFTIKDNSK